MPVAEDNGEPNGRRPGIRFKLAAIIVTAVFVLLIAAFALPHLKRALAVDSCLDAGGRWDYQSHRCQGARR